MAKAGNDVKHSNIFRPLGGNETMYAHMMDTIGGSMLFQMGIVDSSEHIAIEDVREAGRILAAHQEALRAKIVRTDPDPNNFKFSFASLDNWEDVGVRQVTLSSTDDWVDIVNKEEKENKFWREGGPLWGIIYAKVKERDKDQTLPCRCVLILKLHHAICDAISAFDVMYRQFLPILSAVINDGNPNSIIPEDIPLTVSCEETFEKAYLPWYLKGGLAVFRWFNRNFGKKVNYVFEYKDEPTRTKEEIMSDPGYYPCVFSKEVTNSVLNAAKRQGVTVHCVLLGVTSVALSATSDEAGVKLSKDITQGWTIDVRRFLGWQTPQPLCAYSSAAMTTTKHKHDHTDTEFWDMCKTISTSVKSQTTKEKCIPGMGFAEYVMNQSKKTGSTLRLFKEFGFTAYNNISNIGNLSNGPQPKMTPGGVEIKLAEQYFALTGIRAMDGLPFFHAFSTFNEQLMWNVMYNSNKVSKKFVQNYMSKIQEMCVKYCS